MADIGKIVVHNAWTIYGLNHDGSEAAQPLAMLRRPQDWGDPRWTYHRFHFWWMRGPDGKAYVNDCHCWTDLQREPHAYPSLFASLIVQVLIPGSPVEICGRTHLREDDDWDDAWGPTPPFYEEDNDRDWHDQFDDPPETWRLPI